MKKTENEIVNNTEKLKKVNESLRKINVKYGVKKIVKVSYREFILELQEEITGGIK